MPSKTSSGDKRGTLLDQMRSRGEEALGQILEGLMKNKGVADQLGKTIGRAADAKRSVDRNMQFVLSLLNLPSRADYNRLLAKIESLQGSLVNLNMKLDRLMAREHPPTPAKPVRRRKAVRPAAPHRGLSDADDSTS